MLFGMVWLNKVAYFDKQDENSLYTMTLDS